MNVGFSGTLHGMTDAQRASFGVTIMFDVKPTTFRHGGCMGADVEAARLVREISDSCMIHCHPGPEGDHRQEVSGVDDTKWEPKNHFARNRDIVDQSDVLIATPKDMDWQRKKIGGTVYTINYAIKNKKTVYVILPDGDVDKIENGVTNG